MIPIKVGFQTLLIKNYLFTSSNQAPKLLCNVFPFGVTNAGTDVTPAFSASEILGFRQY